ncbi:hypothetical protein LRS03_01090 [Rhizobacter sp. J219]|uniref:hypothetical protein n=1 Tax=Rhizobacter sp. J219 TaxID=2898430 RepID=UPI002151AE90|nr:hypothetical protein [Rhizobacter sp. J219]MCR5881536.1 hypothetical protein [Rhizobacter sp. J219]
MKRPQILGVNRWEVSTAPTEFSYNGLHCTIRMVREWDNRAKSSAQDFEVTVEVRPGLSQSFRLIDGRNVLLSEGEHDGFEAAHAAAQRHPAWRPYDADFTFYVALMIDRFVARLQAKEVQP